MTLVRRLWIMRDALERIIEMAETAEPDCYAIADLARAALKGK